MADTVMTDAPSGDAPFSLRPKYKISDLPLVKEQRTTIESLLYKFKKQGGYDTLRKQVWAAYNTSEGKQALTDGIHEVAEKEIEKDPALLGRERGKAATLISGAVERSGVYQNVESRLDLEIAKHLDVVLESVREIRKADVGAEKAHEEELRGNKTDADYAEETEKRGAERERNRMRMEELARETAELKAKIAKEEERKRRKELAKKEEEARRLQEEEDEKRREARRKRKEEEEKAEEERIKARDERARKREAERKQREKDIEEARERERANRDYKRRDDRRDDRRDPIAERPASNAGTPFAANEPVDDSAIEAAALELLIAEAKGTVDKPKAREFDFERAELRESGRYVSRRRDRSTESSRRDRSRDRRRTTR
jgi:hypothetical protein